MPAIKLKKVTAEYLAEKELREAEKAKEKTEKTAKSLEDVADEEEAAKDDATDEDSEEKKSKNFLEVEILFDKRKRGLPQAEQKLIEWYVVKKSKYRIQNCLGAPFVAYEFVWGRIVNKYAVNSAEKQINDRKVSDCLSLTHSLFDLITTLKQCIHLKLTIE